MESGSDERCSMQVSELKRVEEEQQEQPRTSLYLATAAGAINLDCRRQVGASQIKKMV